MDMQHAWGRNEHRVLVQKYEERRPLGRLTHTGAVKKFPEFCDIDCSVHHEFVPPGQSVTGHLYVQVLQRLPVYGREILKYT
jgi:hypothetical protein